MRVTFARLRRRVAAGVVAIVATVPVALDGADPGHGDPNRRAHRVGRGAVVPPVAAPPVVFSPGTLPTNPPDVFSPGALPKTPSPPPRVTASRRHRQASRRFTPVPKTVFVFVGLSPGFHPSVFEGGRRLPAERAATPPAASVTSFSSLGGPDGAMTLNVTPTTAEVYVDGQYVGIAGTFSSIALTLAPGSHYVELRAYGYRTLGFDTAIESGKTSAFQTVLQPIR